MLNPEIVSRINELNQVSQVARIGDLSSMAGVLRNLQELQSRAKSEKLTSLERVSDAASELVKKIMMDSVPDGEQALGAVRDTARTLRTGAEKGAVPDLAAFPAALGIAAPKAVQLPTTYGDADILADFLSQQSGVLQNMEVHILTLEKSRSPDSLASLLHVLHTMKGDSGFLALSGVEQLCHSTENYLQSATYPYDIETLLMVKDWLASTFASVSTGIGDLPSPAAVIARLENTNREQLEIPPPVAPLAKPAGARPAAQAIPKPVAAPATPAAASTPPKGESPPEFAEYSPLIGDSGLLAEFVSESKEHLEVANNQLLALESDPSNLEALNTVFRAFHTMKGISGFLSLQEISQLAHDTENLLDRVRKEELELGAAVMDVSFEALDMLGKLINNVHKSLESGLELARQPGLPQLLKLVRDIAEGRPRPDQDEEERPRLGEILVGQGVLTENSLEEAIETQKSEAKGRKLGTILVEQNKVPAAKVIEALHKQVPEAEARTAVQVKDTIRVDYERLENMINTIGEMVLAESMISQDEQILRNSSESLSKKVYNLRTVTRKLQELGTSIRMVPVAGTFQKMARLVRDLSRKSGKEILFQSRGDETELDRAFVDKIADPLVHMIRNAVDHGIETPQERQATNKPRAGTIELRAYHEGGNIHVEIRDDGRGLNREAILRKAIEKGMFAADEKLTDNEIYNIIFSPGFSTAKVVTEVSGRGVGMDVVKRNIEDLRGYVQITSQEGQGTTFKIILPLTLALIDGMVVSVGKERYIFPVLSVVESLRPSAGLINSVVGRGEMLTLRTHQVPLYRLGRLFGLPDVQQDISKGLVVVVEYEGRHVGLLVDDLIGMQQTVVKNLGAGIEHTMGFSGGAIMADGRVGLIVDVPGVLKMARNESLR